MRLDDLPPELLHVIAYEGLLKNTDVLNMALSSQSLSGDLLGDCYSKDRFRALSGLRVCLYNGWVRAARFAIVFEDSDALNFAFRLAAENGCTEIVKLLLDDPRVDPGANDNYAIRMAGKIGCTEIVKLLLDDPRVDPCAQRNYAIRMATKKGHTEIVELLQAWRGPNGECVSI